MISIFRNCENLVGRRFNFKSLEKELNNRFGVKGKLQHENIEQFNPDFQMTYIIDKEHCFDIYYLKMRERCVFDKADIYITEIGNEIY